MDLVATLADPDALGAMRAALEPLVHPDFETIADPRYQMLLGDPGQPAGKQSVFYGIDGFLSAFREWVSAWESWVIAPWEFIDVDENRVLVGFEITARSKAQGVEMSIQGGNVVTVSEGKLARLELFFRREEALEAAGLEE